MDQNADTGVPVTPVVNNKQKSGNGGSKIATAIACVLTICGIGFGVYGMLQSAQKDSQISDLKVQIKETGGAVTTIEAPEIDTTTNDGTTATITDTAKVSGGPYIENGYFYVPEWSLKFSIPSELSNYGYAVNYDTAQSGYTLPSIGFTAMLKSDELQNAQARYYDDIETCAIVSVSKEPGTWDAKYHINGTIKQFDDYALLIWNYSRHESCDYDLHIDEVQEKIQTMFSNPEKI
jgi:hypothetical protein